MSLVGRFESVIFFHSMAIVATYSMIKPCLAQIVVNVLWVTTRASQFDYHPWLGTFKLIIGIKVYWRLMGGCWVSSDTSSTNIYNLPLWYNIWNCQMRHSIIQSYIMLIYTQMKRESTEDVPLNCRLFAISQSF